MQFLINEDLPRSTGDLLRSYGHEAIDVRDIGLRGDKDSQIASYAQSRDLCLVTGGLQYSKALRSRVEQRGMMLIEFYKAFSRMKRGSLFTSQV